MSTCRTTVLSSVTLFRIAIKIFMVQLLQRPWTVLLCCSGQYLGFALSRVVAAEAIILALRSKGEDLARDANAWERKVARFMRRLFCLVLVGLEDPFLTFFEQIGVSRCVVAGREVLGEVCRC